MVDSSEDVSRPEDSIKAGNLWTSRVMPINGPERPDAVKLVCYSVTPQVLGIICCLMCI
jgi:hypothetical protein